MYVNSLACVRVQGGESECFRIDNGVKEPREVYHVPLALYCIYGCSDKGDGEEGREWRLPALLYAGDSEENLRSMVGCFVEVYRKGLKVNAGKSKVMVLGGEERLECEVYVDGIRVDHVSEFKYLGCVLDEAGCSRKVASGRRVAGAIRSG